MCEEGQCRAPGNSITRKRRRCDERYAGMTSHGRYNTIVAYPYANFRVRERRLHLVQEVEYANGKCNGE